MKVYALVGPSGTGKSTQALTVAHQWQIPAIIDDGLLIYQGRKVAGYSAKYEQTTVAAVKRAVFHDPSHREEVRESLRKLPVSKVLILGTSKRMVDRIARELGLPPVERYIAIEEVSSAHEIRKAQFIRRTQGKHAIPIPQIQVEKDLWGKLIASVEKIFSPKKEPLGERTIVRPAFQRGEIKVYESALKKLVALSVRRSAPALTIVKTDVRLEPVASVSLAVTIRLAWGKSIPAVVMNVQRAVHEDFLAYLDVELQEVNVHVQRLLLTSRNEIQTVDPEGIR